MENLDLAPKSKNIVEKPTQVMHIGNFDVILNLAYEPRELLQELLTEITYFESMGYSGHKISSIINDPSSEHYQKFFVKDKELHVSSEEKIDFALGRPTDIEMSEDIRKDFDRASLLALASILNEMVISPEIKRIVSTPEFQALAVKQGFKRAYFAEPILAYLDKKNKERFLIYERVKGIDARQIVRDDYGHKKTFENLAEQMRKLFLRNKIIPHDLRWLQFMVTQNGELVLTDAEAYTKKK